MARTLLDLAKSCDKRAAAFGGYGNEAKKRKVMAAIRYLAHATPVDTTNALSNWQVTVDRPADVGRGPFYYGAKGSTAELSAEATILFAAAVLERVKPGQAVYITNYAPYIRRLDEGSSLQHAGGFIRAAEIIIGATQ